MSHLRRLALCSLLSLSSTVTAGINTWTSVGPEGGDINELVITATTPAITYVRTPQELYRSSDAGQTWRAENLFYDFRDLAVHPTQPDRVFVIVTNTLLASSDGGATRTEVALPGGARPTNVQFSPDGTLICMTGARVFYRSNDFGATWTPSTEVSAAADAKVTSVRVQPTNPNRMIASVDPVGLFISSDGGNQWATFTTPSRGASLAFSPASPRIWATSFDGVWYTDDDGVNWTRAAQFLNVQELAVNPSDSSIHVQVDKTIYRSTDEGQTWVPATGTLGIGRVNDFVFDPLAANRVYIASSNGMWVSTDGGASWAPDHKGVIASTPSRLTNSTDRTYFAVRENIHYLASGADHSEVLDLAPLSQALPLTQFDQLLTLHADRLPGGDRLFAGAVNGGLARSMDGGQTWTRLTDPLLNASIYMLDVSATDPNLLLAATTTRLMRSVDGGDHWSTVFGLPSNTAVSGVAFGSGDVAYAGVAQQLYRSVDGGSSWSPVDGDIAPFNNLLSVLDHDNATYVGTSSGAYKSTDRGNSWTLLPVNAGRFAADDTGVYVLSGRGISRSVDKGVTWNASSMQLLGWDPLEMQLDPNVRGRLVMATWYGGVHSYTIASDLIVTAWGQPTVAPGSGARAQLVITVRNNGNHAVTGATLNIRLAGDRTLFDNGTCSLSATSRSEATCALGEIAPREQKVVRIDASFETAGPVGLTTSVAANEVELTAADNTYSNSWSYNAGSSRPGGGGGSLSWLMLASLASLMAVRWRRRA